MKKVSASSAKTLALPSKTLYDPYKKSLYDFGFRRPASEARPTLQSTDVGVTIGGSWHLFSDGPDRLLRAVAFLGGIRLPRKSSQNQELRTSRGAIFIVRSPDRQMACPPDRESEIVEELGGSERAPPKPMEDYARDVGLLGFDRKLRAWGGVRQQSLG